MDDRSIIKLYFDRDEKAISETANSYGRLLLYLAKSMTGDDSDAEEVVNDAYLTAWNSIPPHEPEILLAYLLKIVRNLSCKRLEKKTAAKRAALTVELSKELCDCIPDAETVEKAYEQKELSEYISRFVKTLDREEQYLFMQRYFWSRSIADIASELGQSESKVKSTLFRIRKKLHKELTKAGLL